MAGTQIPITGLVWIDTPEDERRQKLKGFYDTIAASRACRLQEDHSEADPSEGFTVAEGEAAATELGLRFRLGGLGYLLVQPLPAMPASPVDYRNWEAPIGSFTVEDQPAPRREERVARPDDETRRLLK